MKDIAKMWLCLMLVGSMVHIAEAQRITLTIRDGVVAINDKVIPKGDLPEGLDVQNMEVSYSAYGDTRAFIELGGDVYALEAERLLSIQDAGWDVVPHVRAMGSGTPFTTALSEEMVTILEQHAAALQELHGDINVQGRDALRQAGQSVEQAAQAMQRMPALHMQGYLSEMQQLDHELYILLLEELEMERTAAGLATEIRNTPEGPAHMRRVKELRQKLEDIFELKQRNRRGEIQQLEKQINAMMDRIQMREASRDRLIERRLQELLGTQQ